MLDAYITVQPFTIQMDAMRFKIVNTGLSIKNYHILNDTQEFRTFSIIF